MNAGRKTSAHNVAFIKQSSHDCFFLRLALPRGVLAHNRTRGGYAERVTKEGEGDGAIRSFLGAAYLRRSRDVRAHATIVRRGRAAAEPPAPAARRGQPLLEDFERGCIHSTSHWAICYDTTHNDRKWLRDGQRRRSHRRRRDDKVQGRAEAGKEKDFGGERRLARRTHSGACEPHGGACERTRK